MSVTCLWYHSCCACACKRKVVRRTLSHFGAAAASTGSVCCVTFPTLSLTNSGAWSGTLMLRPSVVSLLGCFCEFVCGLYDGHPLLYARVRRPPRAPQEHRQTACSALSSSRRAHKNRSLRLSAELRSFRFNHPRSSPTPRNPSPLHFTSLLCSSLWSLT